MHRAKGDRFVRANELPVRQWGGGGGSGYLYLHYWPPVDREPAINVDMVNTWGTTSSANIERLSKLQKRAARIILKADFLTPSKLMFETLGWLSVPKRIFYNKAILTYKALNNLTPAYISNLLTPISNTHSFSLRSQENGALCIPRSRSALYDRSFSHSASKLWNSLPQNILTINTLASFKTDLRNYIWTYCRAGREWQWRNALFHLLSGTLTWVLRLGVRESI